jgi:hypothetical protein
MADPTQNLNAEDGYFGNTQTQPMIEERSSLWGRMFPLSAGFNLVGMRINL